MALGLTGTARCEEKMGPNFSNTSLWTVSNEWSTLKVCFFLFAERAGIDFLWLFLKSQCYQNTAHYV